jgi:hypothetical protein
VETAVAMEFGASVQPLTSSKARARTKARTIARSGIYDDDGFDDTGMMETTRRRPVSGMSLSLT